MKKIVIFYSLDGNTRFISEKVADALGADLLELKPLKDISNTGFIKYFLGGRQAIMKKEPELLSLDKDPREYDVIFLGTPVWAGTYTPAFHTFFNKVDIKDKKIGLFCCHAGGKGKIFDKMKDRLKDNEFLGEKDFIDPLKRDKEAEAEEAKKWASQLVMSG